jgi:hypothetical protein
MVELLSLKKTNLLLYRFGVEARERVGNELKGFERMLRLSYLLVVELLSETGAPGTSFKN